MTKHLLFIVCLWIPSFLFSVQETEKISQKISTLTQKYPNTNYFDLLSHYLSLSGNINPQANPNSSYIIDVQKTVENAIKNHQGQDFLDKLVPLLIEYEKTARTRYVFYPHSQDGKNN